MLGHCRVVLLEGGTPLWGPIITWSLKVGFFGLEPHDPSLQVGEVTLAGVRESVSHH